MVGWKLFRIGPEAVAEKAEASGSEDVEASAPRPPKWSMGILNDKLTDEVPGEQEDRLVTALRLEFDYAQVPYCCYRNILNETNLLAYSTHLQGLLLPRCRLHSALLQRGAVPELQLVPRRRKPQMEFS
jgi:hypothetical protein